MFSFIISGFLLSFSNLESESKSSIIAESLLLWDLMISKK
jgi:hypothetical protein